MIYAIVVLLAVLAGGYIYSKYSAKIEAEVSAVKTDAAKVEADVKKV